MTQKEFEQYFGRYWLDDLDFRFFGFLFLSLLTTFSVIIYLANLEYDDLNKEMLERYQKYAVQISGRETFTEFIEKPEDALETEKAGSSKSIAKSNADTKMLDPYADLPAADIGGIEFEELSSDASLLPSNTRFFERSSQRSANYDKDAREDLMDHPLPYKIYRDANLYLEIPEYLAETEDEEFGYRDQDEIMKVLYSKEDIIEQCYHKAARLKLVKSGYVKVEFRISPNGYVIPGSIKILGSTIRNRSVEQCIIKNIRRWRSFEKLDETMGIARVIHKFVFN